MPITGPREIHDCGNYNLRVPGPTCSPKETGFTNIFSGLKVHAFLCDLPTTLVCGCARVLKMLCCGGMDLRLIKNETTTV